MRRCNRCFIDKPATHEFFFRNQARKDKLFLMCKDCYKKQVEARERRKESASAA